MAVRRRDEHGGPLQSAAPITGSLSAHLTYSATRDAIEFARPSRCRERQVGARRGLGGRWRRATARPPRPAGRRAGRPGGGARGAGRALADELLGEVRSRRRHRRRVARHREEPAACRVRPTSRRGRCDVHWGRCLPYGEGITYWPVTEIVKSAAGILQSDDRDDDCGEARSFLDSSRPTICDELRTIAAALSNLIGIPTTPRGTYTDQRDLARRAPLGDSPHRCSSSQHEQPTVVVFEDLHWAEPTLLELIAYIAADESTHRWHSSAPRGPSSPSVARLPSRSAGPRRTVELDTLDADRGRRPSSWGAAGDSGSPADAVRASTHRECRRQPALPRRDGPHAAATRGSSTSSGGGTRKATAAGSYELQGLISSRLDRLEPREKQTRP